MGPRKYEKNAEKLGKWPENDRFRIFSIVFPSWSRGFRFFFVRFFFFMFPDLRFLALYQDRSMAKQAPNPPEFAQPHLSRSNGAHPQREGTNLGVFGPVWLVLSWCEATKLGVLDLCHFDLLKQGYANSGGFGAR